MNRIAAEFCTQIWMWREFAESSAHCNSVSRENSIAMIGHQKYQAVRESPKQDILRIKRELGLLQRCYNLNASTRQPAVLQWLLWSRYDEKKIVHNRCACMPQQGQQQSLEQHPKIWSCQTSASCSCQFPWLEQLSVFAVLPSGQPSLRSPAQPKTMMHALSFNYQPRFPQCLY